MTAAGTSVREAHHHPPFPFVVGCGRSGTTLLQVLLDSHPMLAMADNARFLLYGLTGHGFDPDAPFDAKSWADSLFDHPKFERWGFSRKDVHDLVHRSRPSTFAAAIRALYTEFASRQGKHRYGNKTNRIGLHMDACADTFPEARFIHLVRDGRNVALSYLDASWGPDTVDDAARKWRSRTTAARRSGQRLGPGRYLELKYEELVADPARELTRVCEFIEVPMDEDMLSHTEKADRVVARSNRPKDHARVRQPIRRHVRDWRTEMPKEAVREFEAVAGTALRQFGYDTAFREAIR